MSLVPAFTLTPRVEQRPGMAPVHCFTNSRGTDERTLRSFSEEWEKFRAFSAEDLETAGGELFDLLPPGFQGGQVRMLDVGCGSGRWTRYLAHRMGHVDAVDPSDAIFTAATTHADLQQVRWGQAWAEQLPFGKDSFDLVLCIGVLHHLHDPVAAMREALRVLRPGGCYYLYMYYALEHRSRGYRALYKASDLMRRGIHRLPGPLKRLVCEALSLLVYAPLVALVRLLKGIGWKHWHRLPLAYYHNKRFRLMRNDALDRFGTPVEERYTQEQVRTMLEAAGFREVQFSPQAPFWHAIANKP